jgi:short-subunit dehydrogenase
MPANPNSFNNMKVAVITGASSGIGAATARKLAQGGLHVVLVARRQERLASLADEIQSRGGQAHVIAADLAEEAGRISVFEQVSARYGAVDVLVNNAGLGWYGYCADMPWTTAQEILKVNIEAVVQLTMLFLPGMRERNSGHIINIGSVVGGLASQGVALYSASKSFLDSFTTSLYRELAGSQVRVSVVRAGPVTSEFFETAATRPSGSPIPAERFGIAPEVVAGRVWSLLHRPRKVVYVPKWLRVAPWIEFWFGWLEDRLGPFVLRNQALTRLVTGKPRR